MAGHGSSRWTAVCFLASFLWLSHSLDRLSLIENPRLSALLLLSMTSALAFVASVFSKYLPGADGRFDSTAVLRSSLPQRPLRFYIPCIIVLIIARLETLYRILHDFQCTVQGVEAFLPLVLASHEFILHKVIRSAPEDGPEDMWGSVWEDFKEWASGHKIPLLLSTLLFSHGTFFVADFVPRSSFYCSASIDHSSWVVFLQWTGLFIDATILILSWRVLSWTRTTTSKLRTLSVILATSSLGSGLIWTTSRVYRDRSMAVSQPSFHGLDSLYVFDVFGTGITCATFVIAAALYICDSGPLMPMATTTFISGVAATIKQILYTGTYRQVTKIGQLVVALSMICIGFSHFTYINNIRYIVFVHRAFLVFLLVCTMTAALIVSLKWDTPLDRHTVNELIFQNRVQQDRWLRNAAISTTLKLAVAEYEERYHRDPPLGFDKWFDYAQQRNTVIVDRFYQIETDILPFWGMKPEKIRDGLEITKGLPHVGIISVAGGKAYHNQPADPGQKRVLDQAVTMISSFAEHLPEMSLVVNLDERPRILVPSDEIRRLADSAMKLGAKLLPGSVEKRQAPELAIVDTSLGNPAGLSSSVPPNSHSGPFLSTGEFRRLQALTCPPGSAIRSGLSWNTRDLCATCAIPHSLGQFLQDWEKQLIHCHQPDIFHLHEFHALPHRYDLHQDLLPLFSKSKSHGFRDLLIPLLPSTNASQEIDHRGFYDKKFDDLFWQDEPMAQPLTYETLHGGHRNRFVQLINKAAPSDKTSMLLAFGTGKDAKYQYEDVSVADANGVLPLSVSYTSPRDCDDASCQFIRQEFGFTNRSAPLDHRYIMLLDSADGPSPNVLQTIRSNSVPVISSIFRQWYTERLMPWVHFVPIDTRYHGFHSTMAYFFGLKAHGKVNGKDQVLEGRRSDAEWISEEGRKWAEKALRREDMEVYLFRLLLEYGRVINDDREHMGFALEEKA